MPTLKQFNQILILQIALQNTPDIVLQYKRDILCLRWPSLVFFFPSPPDGWRFAKMSFREKSINENISKISSPRWTRRGIQIFISGGLNICAKFARVRRIDLKSLGSVIKLKWNDVENGAADEPFKSFQRYYLIDRVHRRKARLCRIQVQRMKTLLILFAISWKTFCIHCRTLGTFVTWIRWNWTPVSCQVLTLSYTMTLTVTRKEMLSSRVAS